VTRVPNSGGRDRPKQSSARGLRVVHGSADHFHGQMDGSPRHHMNYNQIPDWYLNFRRALDRLTRMATVVALRSAVFGGPLERRQTARLHPATSS
jgi:hypothetical protein